MSIRIWSLSSCSSRSNGGIIVTSGVSNIINHYNNNINMLPLKQQIQIQRRNIHCNNNWWHYTHDNTSITHKAIEDIQNDITTRRRTRRSTRIGQTRYFNHQYHIRSCRHKVETTATNNSGMHIIDMSNNRYNNKDNNNSNNNYNCTVLFNNQKEYYLTTATSTDTLVTDYTGSQSQKEYQQQQNNNSTKTVQEPTFTIVEYPASSCSSSINEHLIVSLGNDNEKRILKQEQQSQSSLSSTKIRMYQYSPIGSNDNNTISSSPNCSNNNKNNNNARITTTTKTTTTWQDIVKDPFAEKSERTQQKQQLHDNTSRDSFNQYISKLYLIPSILQKNTTNIIVHFLPANYPHSVSSSYKQYASYSFLASIAGSANMVASTQMLLVAVVIGTGSGDSLGTDIGNIVTSATDAVDNTMMLNSSSTTDMSNCDSQNTTLPITNVDDSTSSSNQSSSNDSSNEQSSTVATAGTSTSASTSNMAITSVATISSLGVLGGALNWIIKDGIGQLGGILFASVIGQSRTVSYDTCPRYWKMISCIVMDCSSFIEIITATYIIHTYPIAIVPIACCSSILKNIAYLTSSASRAAIHQSLITKVITTTDTSTTNTATDNSTHAAAATTKQSNSSSTPITTAATATTSSSSSTTIISSGGNLADVTAKSASQSMVSGLIGTTIGISLSTAILQLSSEQYTNVYYISTFLTLSAIQQVCNYISLRPIAIRYFNYDRLYIVLQHYINTSSNDYDNDDDDDDVSVVSTDNQLSSKAVCLSPEQVATKESFVPYISTLLHSINSTYTKTTSDGVKCSICIGNTLSNVCPNGPDELLQLRQIMSSEKYVVNITSTSNNSNAIQTALTVQLLFLDDANGIDQIKGLYHAMIIQQYICCNKHSLLLSLSPSTTTTLISSYIDKNIIQESYHQIVIKHFPNLLQQLYTMGWNVRTEVTNIEPRNSKRIIIYD